MSTFVHTYSMREGVGRTECVRDGQVYSIYTRTYSSRRRKGESIGSGQRYERQRSRIWSNGEGEERE